jgi:hypothetical protein
VIEIPGDLFGLYWSIIITSSIFHCTSSGHDSSGGI